MDERALLDRLGARIGRLERFYDQALILLPFLLVAGEPAALLLALGRGFDRLDERLDRIEATLARAERRP